MTIPSNVQKIVPESTEQWLKIKEEGIGGSELAAVCGLSKWSSPREVWLMKTGRKTFPEMTPVMLRGKCLEDGFFQMFLQLNDRKAVDDTAGDILYRRIDKPFIMVTPDRQIYSEDGLTTETCEIKTTFMRLDEAEIYWLIQLMWEMGGTGDQIGHLIWEYPDPRVCQMSQQFEFNKDLFVELEQKAEYFWTEYVLKDVEPPCSTEFDISDKFAKEVVGRSIQCTEDVALRHSDMVVLRNTISTDKKTLEDYKTDMKIYMEDAEKLMYMDQTLCSWKVNKGGNRVFKF